MIKDLKVYGKEAITKQNVIMVRIELYRIYFFPIRFVNKTFNYSFIKPSFKTYIHTYI